MGAKTRKLSQINDSLIEWQSVVVADGSTGLTAVAGRGYFINTTGGTITVTLPSATVKPGDTIQLKDYARTWATNNVTLSSNLFDGTTSAPTFETNGQTVTLVYMDNTRGWSLINEDTTSDFGPLFTSATGGTITTSGDFKIHSFTGDGCFAVSILGNPAGGSNKVDYLVVAGGGGGGFYGGGGGAGGFREGRQVAPAYTASPLVAASGLTITATTFPISVGSGGAGAAPGTPRGVSGSSSIFSTITSTGGGGGGSGPASGVTGNTGGSGGGGAPGTPPGNSGALGGTGNTPPTSPPQGNNGGQAWHACGIYQLGGGGGGATVVGSNAPQAGAPATGNTTGGNGATTSISGSSTSYSGGGGGGSDGNPRPGGTGGTGGGGNGGTGPNAGTTAGGANTGGGGGGGSNTTSGGAGGSGLVVIRYKFQ